MNLIEIMERRYSTKKFDNTRKISAEDMKQITASDIVVLCARTSMDEDYLQHILEKEDQDGRFANEEIKNGMHGGRSAFVNFHKNDYNDLQYWMDKQVYLNMGSLLLGSAVLGIDAVPMEGFDVKVLNEELGLTEKGLTAVALVPLGYKANDDFNAQLPKSRLSEEEVFTTI